MNHTLEMLFFIGGTILLWGKIIGYLLALGLTLLVSNKLIKWATTTPKGVI